MRYFLFFFFIFSSLSFADNPPQNQTKDSSLLALLSAEFSIHRQQYADALDFYLQALKNHPQNGQIAERATRLALYTQQYSIMLENAKRWQKAAPKDANAVYFTSLAYALNDQANVALDTMQRALNLGGKTDFARITDLLKIDSPSQGFYVQSLFQAANEHPKNPDIALALAMLYARQNDKTRALDYLDKANSHSTDKTAMLNYAVPIYLKFDAVEPALAVYQQAISQQPNNLELREELLRLANQFAPEEALIQIDFLLKKQPNNNQLLLNKALIQIKLKQFTQAKEPLKKLLQEDQQQDAAHYYLGLIDYYHNDNTSALAHFLNVKGSREYLSAQEYLIRIYDKQGLFNEALTRADNAISYIKEQALEAKNLTPFYLLKAQLLQQQGKLDNAYQLLSQLLEAQPKALDLRYARAMLAEKLNKLTEMEADLRFILKQEPNNTMALNTLGYTLTNHSTRFDEALELIQKAHQLQPDDPAILDSLGWVLYHKGQNKDALLYLNKALKLYPNDEIASHLAEVLWQSGDKKQARAILRDALKNSPNSPYLLNLIKKLNVSL